MAGNSLTKTADLSADYQEESIRTPALITLVLMVLISIPLGSWIYRINMAGKNSSNVTKYEKLVKRVDGDVQIVSTVLNSDTAEMEAIQASRSAGTVRLIVPEVVIVEKRDKPAPDKTTLDFELDGIYWSIANPLVTIEGETYRIGDTVYGYTIVEIRKRSVIFKGKDGKLVEKDIYGDLLQKK